MILPGHVAGCRCGSYFATLAAEPADDASVMTDTLLAEAGREWSEISDPLLRPLMAATADAGLLAEALALIAQRVPDGAQLLERLAVATATARAIGDFVD